MFPPTASGVDWDCLVGFADDEPVPFDEDLERWVLSGFAAPETTVLPGARLVRAWADDPADGLLWQGLLATAPGTLFDREERVGAWSRLVAAATGGLYVEMAGLHAAFAADPPFQAMMSGDILDSAASFIGAAMKVASRTAKDQLGEALRLPERLPATMAAVCAGQVSPGVARAVLQETDLLECSGLPAVEAVLFPALGEMTPGQARAAAKKAALAADPKTAEARARKARKGRRVEHTPAPDGMG